MVVDVLSLNRVVFSDRSTIGDLRFLGEPFCNTIELSCRRGDEKGLLAVDPGRYKFIVTESPRLKRLTPRLVDVPGRSGILIHPANRAEELDGCIAPGIYSKTIPDFVGESRKYFDLLMAKLQGLNEPMYITIIGGRKSNGNII